MAFGLTRLNERHQRPNTLINFIKPLSSPHSDLSQDFLDRIAAMVYPVMRAHTITVMSLEEYPPNKEFVGRNFNAGECIQLVLKSYSTGQWLSFRSVQMVMMHELAHCKQMNHSRAFWAVRNSYADHLRVLWGQQYQGEGVWGRGQTLVSGRFENDHLPDAASGVDSLCGGAYRGQRSKRKRLTYAQRRDRRVERKFGKHGVGNEVGADTDVKAVLEKARRTTAKPKVAGSKRGRELRAAAALARFGKAEACAEPEPAEPDDVETESEEEYDGLDGPALVDDKGEQVKDAQGNKLVRVCEGEDLEADDDYVRREMEELRTADEPRQTAKSVDKSDGTIEATSSIVGGDDVETEPEPEPVTTVVDDKRIETKKAVPTRNHTPLAPAMTPGTCIVCSLENHQGAATCVACAHVLDSAKIAGAWECKGQACSKDYLNAGDCGVCGLCGKPRA